MRFSARTIPKRVEGTDGSPLGAEFVVLDAPGRIVRGLNPTGARIFNLCDGRNSAEQIARTIAAEFDADLTTVLPDVLGFLEALGARGLIVPRAEGVP
ncbi:MAG: PqqD family protein [Myxococcaceae bacterium]|nr:PqqD family protein [Myxococcaceae bacterium]